MSGRGQVGGAGSIWRRLFEHGWGRGEAGRARMGICEGVPLSYPGGFFSRGCGKELTCCIQHVLSLSRFLFLVVPREQTWPGAWARWGKGGSWLQGRFRTIHPASRMPNLNRCNACSAIRLTLLRSWSTSLWRVRWGGCLCEVGCWWIRLNCRGWWMNPLHLSWENHGAWSHCGCCGCSCLLPTVQGSWCLHKPEGSGTCTNSRVLVLFVQTRGWMPPTCAGLKATLTSFGRTVALFARTCLEWHCQLCCSPALTGLTVRRRQTDPWRRSNPSTGTGWRLSNHSACTDGTATTAVWVFLVQMGMMCHYRGKRRRKTVVSITRDSIRPVEVGGGQAGVCVGGN